jgi:hypothetical protein
MYINSVQTSQETHHVSTTEPNRLMLCGETVAVYCENRTEHTDTLWAVRTSQETHHVSATEPNRLMLCGEQSLFAVTTVRNTQIHRVDSPYLTGNTSCLRYRAQPVNAAWGTVAVCCENRTEHTDTLCGQSVPHRKHVTSPLQSPAG